MSSSAASHTQNHVLPLKIYLGIGAALLFLTFVTVEVSFYDFGGLNIVIALAIASIKALLVAFFFMHLWYDNKLFFIAFTVCLLCLTVFIVLTMFDTTRRGDIDELRVKPINPRAEMYNSAAFNKGAAGHDSSGAKIDSTTIDTSKVISDSTSATPATVPAATNSGH